MSNKHEISIIGVGNIGIRYLEAILKIQDIKKVNLIEIRLDILKERLLKENYNFDGLEISFHKNISKKILNLDLIIISTTSSQRYEVCEELQANGYKGKLLLEKFLFPNLNIILQSEKLFKNYPSNIYVNQWMRKTALSNILNIKKPFEISIIGDNLGILSNAVHFIDLIGELYD